MEVLSLLICLIVASLLKGYYDKSSENRIKNPWVGSQDYWNKPTGAKYKWKINDKGEQVERFWGSSRWFVFLTDGWHLIQFLMYRFLDYPSIHIIHNLYDNYLVTGLTTLLIVFIRGAFFELVHNDRKRYTLFNLCTKISTRK